MLCFWQHWLISMLLEIFFLHINHIYIDCMHSIINKLNSLNNVLDKSSFNVIFEGSDLQNFQQKWQLSGNTAHVCLEYQNILFHIYIGWYLIYKM